jgi:dolichol-phosphate mannosyltransferase
VSHRARRHGASNYGTFDRLWVGLVDIAGVIWLQRRWRRPVLGAVVPIEEPVVHAVREPAIAAQDG